MSRTELARRSQSGHSPGSLTCPRLTASIRQRVRSYSNDLSILVVELLDPVRRIAAEDGDRVRQATGGPIPGAGVCAERVKEDVVKGPT